MLYKRVGDAPDLSKDRVTRIYNVRLAPCNDDWKTLPTGSVNLYGKENRTRQTAWIWKRSRGYANRLRGNFNSDIGERAGRGSPAVIGRDDAKNGQMFR